MVRSFRRNGRKHYGTSSSRERHDHARRQSSNTAIASFARAAGRVSFAAQIWVVAILRDVSLEFVLEAVGLLQDGSLSGEPERASEAGVAIFGDLAWAAEHAGLDGGKIHAAKLQKLTVMVEAAQVTGLGQDGQRVDWSYDGYGAQQLVIGSLSQQFDRPVFDGVALACFANSRTRISVNPGQGFR